MEVHTAPHLFSADMFQDPQRMPEITGHTELLTHGALSESLLLHFGPISVT